MIELDFAIEVIDERPEIAGRGSQIEKREAGVAIHGVIDFDDATFMSHSSVSSCCHNETMRISVKDS